VVGEVEVTYICWHFLIVFNCGTLSPWVFYREAHSLDLPPHAQQHPLLAQPRTLSCLRPQSELGHPGLSRIIAFVAVSHGATANNPSAAPSDSVIKYGLQIRKFQLISHNQHRVYAWSGCKAPPGKRAAWGILRKED